MAYKLSTFFSTRQAIGKVIRNWSQHIIYDREKTEMEKLHVSEAEPPHA